MSARYAAVRPDRQQTPPSMYVVLVISRLRIDIRNAANISQIVNFALLLITVCDVPKQIVQFSSF